MTDPRMQMQLPPPQSGTGGTGVAGIGPLVIAALGVGGLGLLLVLISMPMGLIKTVEKYRYDSSGSWTTTTHTYDMFDLAEVLPILALAVALLLAVAALTRGRYHVAARIGGGVAALYTVVYIFAVWRSLARYVGEEQDKNDKYQTHLLAGWYLALAGSLLLIAAVAMAQRLPQQQQRLAQVTGPTMYPQQVQPDPQQYQAPEYPVQQYQQPGYPQQYQQYPPG
jgi:hypothetical protein